jgi:hypothetical protein
MVESLKVWRLKRRIAFLMRCRDADPSDFKVQWELMKKQMELFEEEQKQSLEFRIKARGWTVYETPKVSLGQLAHTTLIKEKDISNDDPDHNRS